MRLTVFWGASLCSCWPLLSSFNEKPSLTSLDGFFWYFLKVSDLNQLTAGFDKHQSWQKVNTKSMLLKARGKREKGNLLFQGWQITRLPWASAKPCPVLVVAVPDIVVVTLLQTGSWQYYLGQANAAQHCPSPGAQATRRSLARRRRFSTELIFSFAFCVFVFFHLQKSSAGPQNQFLSNLEGFSPSKR